jgi:hypothetical protein
MTTDVVNRLAACENKPSIFLIVALTTGTAVQASTVDLFVTSVVFYGYKDAADDAVPTSNTGDTALGYTVHTGSNVNVAINSPVFLDTIPAGGSVTERPTLGAKYNLKDFWFLGLTNDAIVIGYEA